jgi:hypothetical protein
MKKYSTMDEHLIHLGQASTVGMSIARTWIYKRNHSEEDENEDNVVTPIVHQRGGEVNPG